jgi:carbonic anhydrase
MSIMDKVRRRQEELALSPSSGRKPPKHLPQILYIGCIDARLDPIRDIGIDKGTAFIFRNIGALVPAGGHVQTDLKGKILQNTSIGAALELFLNHIPYGKDKMKHIVVSGHTDCNGIKTYWRDGCSEHEHNLSRYLENLSDVRARLMKKAKAKKWSDAQALHALEEESVRQSVANLKTYPVVRQAVKAGTLELHGWVIDTHTQHISEMNPRTLVFEPMGA